LTLITNKQKKLLFRLKPRGYAHDTAKLAAVSLAISGLWSENSAY